MSEGLPDGMSEEEREQRDFFVQLLRTEVFKRVLEPDFDEKARDMCLEATGRLCCNLFLPWAGLSTDCDIDTFLENMTNRFPGVRNLERKGEVVHIEMFGGEGECGCPLIRDKHHEPTPLWCQCGNYWYKTMLEAVVGHPVQVELIDSCLGTGASTCVRVAHLKPPTCAAGLEEVP